MLASSFVPREDYLTKLRSALLHQDQGRILGLWGAGGFGKTTLAEALSRDPSVREKFKDGVFWVVLGQNVSESDLVIKLNDLSYLVSGRRLELQDLHMVARQLAVELGEKAVLIVVDDVWRLSNLEPVLQGRNTRFLVTSRDRSCLPGDAVVVAVREMTAEQSRLVLRAGLAEDVDQLDALLPICAGWPVLLNVINARLRQDRSEGIALKRSIDLVVKAHQESGLSAFDEDPGKYREVALSSLLIDSVERRGARIKESCLDLGIFPEDAEIPTSVLAKYWDIQETRVLDLCRRLFDASVVERYSVGRERPSIQLHDAIREALRAQAGPSLTERSGRFIEAIRPKRPGGAPQPWLELPSAELYLWRHLGWHLRSAGYWREFVETFGDLAFLAAHSGICGRAITLREVTLAAEYSPDLGKTRDFLRRKGHLLDPLSAAPDRQTTLAIHLGGSFPAGPHLEVVWSCRSFGEGTRVAGHQGSATSCDVDPGGNLVVTTGSDGEVHIRRWPQLEERITCRGHYGWVRCAAILAGGPRVVSGGDDNSLRLWDVATGQAQGVFLGHGGCVRSCTVVPGRDCVASASDDATVRLWEVSTGNCIGILEGHAAAVLCCAADPAGRWIVSGSEDGTLRLWPLNGTASRAIVVGSGAVRCCAVGPDGRWLVSGGNDSVLRVWNAENGELLREIPGHRRAIRACGLSSDGSRVVSAGGDDRTVRVFDTRTGEALAVLETDGSWVMGCRFLRDDLIVATSVDGSTRFWSASTWERLAIVEGQSTFLWACAAGKDWAVAGGVDGTVTQFSLTDGKVVAKIRDHRGCIRRLRIGRRSRLVFSASDDGEIRRWEPGASQTAIVCKHVGGARSLALREEDGLLLTCGHDGLVKVWDADSENGASCVSEFRGHTAEVLDCDFLPANGELRAVSVSSDTTARIWRLDTGQELRRLIGHRKPVVSCSVSSRQRPILATVADDLVVRIWDLATFENVAFEGHQDWISQAVFSPDGSLLATASDDRTVRLWDCESGAPLAALALDESLYACDWRDNDHLLVAGAGGVIFLVFKRDRTEAHEGGGQER